MPLQSVTATEVFTQEELATITACWDESKPQGKFLKDRHGFTHYRLDGSGQGPMVVLCHGLGTSMKAFEIISEDLVNSGYSVLRYDYYGHGYSKYGDGGKHLFFAYDPDMFVDQLDDLLDHIEKEEGVHPAAICGHSTGGVVCVAANDRWSKKGSKRGIVPKIILISPAFYTAQKVSLPN
jgi:alpha-beta hydrolase superfamily lysophospholipase